MEDKARPRFSFVDLVGAIAQGLAFKVEPREPVITLQAPHIVKLPNGGILELPEGSTITLKGWKPKT